MVVFFVQLHFTTRVRYGFLSVQLNYTIRLYLYFLTIAKILFPLLTFPYLTRVLSVDVYGMVSYVRATIIYMQILVDFGFSLSAVKDIARIKNDKTRVGEITGDVIIAKLLLCAIGMVILLALCVSISILQNNFLYTFLSYVVYYLYSCLIIYSAALKRCS